MEFFKWGLGLSYQQKSPFLFNNRDEAAWKTKLVTTN